MNPEAMIPLDDIQAELAERRLFHFLRHAWHVLEPGKEFVESRGVETVCEYLEAVTLRTLPTQHLIINIAPRCTKSITASVCWQPWEWLRSPSVGWLFSSHAASLALRDNVRSRDLILSPWYQERWGDRFELKKDQNEKGRYENTKRGYRIAIGTGGALTGEGGDRCVADDPQNVDDIWGETYRVGSARWWDNAFSTRLNDRKTSSRVLITQRTHPDDLTGHIKEGEQEGLYTFLEIKTKAEGRTVVSMPVSGEEWVREDGEFLCPERLGEKEWEDVRLELGPRGRRAQHQQDPDASEEGSLVKRDEFRFYKQLPEDFDRFVLVADTAAKEKESNDYTVFQLWGDVVGWDYYLISQWRDKLLYPKMKRKLGTIYTSQDDWALVKYERHISAIVVEDKSTGEALIPDLQELYGPLVVPMKAEKDKVQRFNVHALPAIEVGRIHLPESSPWLETFLSELFAFPDGKHDDQVDTMVHAITWLKQYAQRPSARLRVFH